VHFSVRANKTTKQPSNQFVTQDINIKIQAPLEMVYKLASTQHRIMHLHPGATFQHLGPDQVVANTKEHWLVICGDKEAAKACLVELPRKTQNNYKSRAGTQLGPGWGHSRPMPKESQYCMFVMSLIQTKASLRKPYSEFVLEPDSEPGAAEESGSDAEQHCGKAEHPPAESRASYEYSAGSESEEQQDKSEELQCA
jgi:hypothetical protein